MSPPQAKATNSANETAVLRAPVSAQLLLQFALEQGMAARDVLHGSHLQPSDLQNPEATITAAQELLLIGNLLDGLGEPAPLGFALGARYHISTYGIWGFALLSSPTFRSAAQLAVRYLDLSYAFARYELQDQNGALNWLLDVRDHPPKVGEFLVARDVAAWANFTRELRPGGFTAERIEFAFSEPRNADQFAALSTVPVTYDAPCNAVLMAQEDLDAALPQADPILARLCENQCRQLLEKRRVRSGFAGQVREQLLRNPKAMPGLSKVAERLNVSERSLRRYLDAEGTRFRTLVDEVRETLAEEMLMTADMKMVEISERLGYAEPAAFMNAFKRWKGQSPAAYRSARIRASD